MATAAETAPIDAAIEAVLNRLKVNISLKSELHLALKAFIQKRNVFCVLPIGFKRRQMQADPNPLPFEIAQTGHNTRPRDRRPLREWAGSMGWIQANTLYDLKIYSSLHIDVCIIVLVLSTHGTKVCVVSIVVFYFATKS